MEMRDRVTTAGYMGEILPARAGTVSLQDGGSPERCFPVSNDGTRA